MKLKLFAPYKLPLPVDIVLLLARLVCGYAFIIIGWPKIKDPFNWIPAEMGFPQFLIGLAALSEFGGGILLLLGLLTRLAAFGISCTMLVAIYVHITVMGDPFINPTGGGSYQIAVAYLLLALLFLVAGPGRYSVDRRLFGEL